MANTGGMIVGLLSQVDTISQDFVFQGYQNLVSAYSPAIHGLIALSIIIYGYAALQGWVNFSFAETSKRLLTIGFVLALALNWGTFSSYVYDLFTKVPNEVSSHLIQSIPGTHFSNSESVTDALQDAWLSGYGFAAALWSLGGLHSIAPYLWGTAVLVIVVVVVGFALIELVVAKFGVAIFLVLAPLIIPMVLFKATKEVVFDGWLKHLVSFAFIPVFVVSALTLGLSLLSSSILDMKNTISSDSLTITTIAPYIIYSIVCFGLLYKAAHMAASMASGFSTGSSSALKDILKKLLPKKWK